MALGAATTAAITDKLRAIGVACVLIAACLAALGHRWVALGWNAWRYPTAAAHDRTQIAFEGNLAYLAAGVDGIDIVDLTRGQRIARIAPQAPADRIDDVAIAEGRLFALDATPPGHLLAYALGQPQHPRLLDRAAVPVGPFSGVSTAAGLVAVSGGTAQLTLRGIDANGRLGTTLATADFGRGQPDIALRADGRFAAISTHRLGPDFALTLVEIDRAPLRLRAVGRVDLRDAGFTEGGFKPAHFPLVAAWGRNHVYVADGGGLHVIDATDPRHPRLLTHDRRALPAIDVARSDDALYVLRAGTRPALLRYRLDRLGQLTFAGQRPLPIDTPPAAVAANHEQVLVTKRSGGWTLLPVASLTP